MRKIIAMFTAAAVMMAALAGCSTDDKETSGTTTALADTEAVTSDTTGESTESEDETEAETEAETVAETTAFSWEGINVTDHIELGEYLGINYTLQEATVTEDEIQTEIESILDSAASPAKLTEGTVTEEDVVNIDFVGKIDGEEFTGGSTTPEDGGVLIDIDNNTYIEGFSDSIIGMNVGDTKDAEMTFPDDYYNTDYAGKDVVFSITVNYIQGETEYPEYTDEFVSEKSEGEYTTTDEYTEYIRSYMLTEKETNIETEQQNEVWAAILENSKVISFPEGLVESYYNSYVDYYGYYASMYGIELEEFVESYLGITYDEFLEYAQSSAEQNATSELLFKAIAEKEKLEITDEEYAEGLTQMAADYDYTDEAAFEEAYTEAAIRDNLLYSKVIEYVMEKAVGVEGEESTTEETSAEDNADGETADGETVSEETNEDETADE